MKSCFFSGNQKIKVVSFRFRLIRKETFILEIIVETKISFLFVSFLGTRKEIMVGYFWISQEMKRNVFVSFLGTQKRHGTVRKLRNKKVVFNYLCLSVAIIYRSIISLEYFLKSFFTTCSIFFALISNIIIMRSRKIGSTL